MIAIRGAVRVDVNEREEIYRRTRRLLREIRDRNSLDEPDVLSALFTMTPDLNADFPARAAREMGWTETAMLGAQETAVPGAPDRMIRVLVHAEAPGPPRHVYLGDAAALRPDLAREGDAAAGREAAAGGGTARGDGSGRGGSAARRAAAAQGARAAEARPHGTLLVVGLGLIGGSAAMALRRRGPFARVLGHDVHADARDGARRAGAVDEVVPSPGPALERADAVLLTIPIPAIGTWLDRWGDALEPGTVVVDAGSTKRGIVRAMESLPDGVEAVGGHPMAGSERSGIGAARPDLFHGAAWVLVETERTGDRGRTVAEALVDGVEARPTWIDADAHDRAVAATSHLPYLLSAALALHLDGTDPGTTPGAASGPAVEPGDLLGPGARDMLRLAGSESGLMSGILTTNWDDVRREVASYRDVLARLVDALDASMGGDGEPGARGPSGAGAGGPELGRAGGPERGRGVGPERGRGAGREPGGGGSAPGGADDPDRGRAAGPRSALRRVRAARARLAEQALDARRSTPRDGTPPDGSRAAGADGTS